jgi:peptidoglycan L-alanyl-D-glutamate endopeptidase CwlK
MPKFSNISRARLATCHPALQELFEEVILSYDCAILCGYRGQEEQDEAFSLRTSTKRWPESKHNVEPSLAIDVAPYFMGQGVDWEDLPAFAYFAGYVRRVAEVQRVHVRWGGDWNGNNRTNDERLVDMVHFELAQG